jgi:hypothetical protein
LRQRGIGGGEALMFVCSFVDTDHRNAAAWWFIWTAWGFEQINGYFWYRYVGERIEDLRSTRM